MRQTRWATPGAARTRVEYNTGALRALMIGERQLLAGMYCSVDGFHRVDLRDAGTGEVVDVHGGDDNQWWHDPADHFGSFGWRNQTYLTFVKPPNGYAVLRVDSDGLRWTCGATANGSDAAITAVAPALDGGPLPSVVTCGSSAAQFRSWQAGDRVLASVRLPEGWCSPRLLAIDGRPYAWLRPDVPGETPAGERWRVAAERGRLLWDLTSRTPVGSPLVLPGSDWGPWVVSGRPVALVKVGWGDFQVWDLAGQEPLGPGLGDLRLSNPSVGLLQDRPVLAATVRRTLCVWDVGTGRLLGERNLPDPPIATAIGAAGTVWAIGGTGYVARLAVTPMRSRLGGTRLPSPPSSRG